MTDKEITKKYLGIPYRHRGRSLKGLDCWGLVVLVYKDFGIDILDLQNYRENWAREGKNYFIENYYEKWHEVTEPCLLDVLLFNNRQGTPYHAGIYLNSDRFIQGNTAGVVVSRLAGKWQERLEGIYRYDTH